MYICQDNYSIIKIFFHYHTCAGLTKDRDLGLQIIPPVLLVVALKTLAYHKVGGFPLSHTLARYNIII